MKIGIDVSQIVYPDTGVANYLSRLVKNILTIDKENEYVLFFSSLRKKFLISNFKFLNKSQSASWRTNPNIKIKTFRFPPLFLDFIWNRLHIFPIEWFIGPVDVFISSDWTQAPTIRAKKATILYDSIVYKYPKETDSKIVSTQKRRLKWVKKECDIIFCISEATKKDAREILGINEKKLHVLYPGV